MQPFKAAALAAISLMVAGPCLAQSAAPPADQTSAGEPPANEGPYAGTSRRDFYQPADRIGQIQGEIQQGALAASQARRALAQLSAIRQDLGYRIARHNGDLRDWDRELINRKLDDLVKQYPALQS